MSDSISPILRSIGLPFPWTSNTLTQNRFSEVRACSFQSRTYSSIASSWDSHFKHFYALCLFRCGIGFDAMGFLVFWQQIHLRVSVKLCETSSVAKEATELFSVFCFHILFYREGWFCRRTISRVQHFVSSFDPFHFVPFWISFICWTKYIIFVYIFRKKNAKPK